MRTVMRLGLLLVFWFAADVGQSQEPVIKTFPTGARPTPAHRIAAAVASGKVAAYKAVAAPEQVAMIPSRLSYWGNDRYGICVSAESAFAIGSYSKFVAAETYITEETIISWARAHGVLNGADLLSVIEDMQQDGVKDEKGRLWKEGTASIVDFHSEISLKSAIATGPISIAIASASLPSNAGGKSGWFIVTPRNSRATDHCVSLPGYGKAKWLCEQLGVPLPAGLDPNRMMYLLFTWNSIGLVSFEWLQGTCVEAWLRTPTVVGLPSPSPDPGPGPTPDPGPGPKPVPTGVVLTIDKTLQAGSYEVLPAGTTKRLKDAIEAIKEIEKLLHLPKGGSKLKIFPEETKGHSPTAFKEQTFDYAKEIEAIKDLQRRYDELSPVAQLPVGGTKPVDPEPPVAEQPEAPRKKFHPYAVERDPKTGKVVTTRPTPLPPAVDRFIVVDDVMPVTPRLTKGRRR